jgi:hypothetical protein
VRSPEKIDRVALAACLVAGLAVRLAWIGRDDLWSDEVHTLHTVSLPLADVVDERLNAGHVPLYFLLLRGWTALAGTSQAALRAPSAVFGTALLLPAALLLRRLVPAASSRWALVLLAFHPAFVELSREARMYSLLGLVFLVTAEAAVAALDEGRVPARFWIAAGIGPFVHPSWGFAAAPLAVWLAVEARRGSRATDGGATDADAGGAAAARRAALGLVGSLVLLVVLLAQATPQHQELTRRPWWKEMLVVGVRPFVGSDLRPELTTILALTLVGWAVCLWRGFREDTPRARRFAVALGAGVPVASVASGAIGGVPWGPVRYVHLCGLGFVALAGLAAEHSRRVQEEVRRRVERAAAESGSAPAFPGLQDMLNGLRRDWIGVPWLCAALLVLLGSRISAPRTAWSGAAREVLQRVPAGETVWVNDAGSAVVLGHYAGREVRVGAPVPAARHWRVAVDARTTVPTWQVVEAPR